MAIAHVALPVASDQLFDYWVPAGLVIQAGSLLHVELGRRRMVGVAASISDESTVTPERLLPIEEVITEILPLPADLLELGRFIASDYQQPIGQCFGQMLPLLADERSDRAPLHERYRISAAGRIALSNLANGRARRMRALLALLDTPAGRATNDLRNCGTHAWRVFSAWRSNGWVEQAQANPADAACALVLNQAQSEVLAAVVPTPLAFQPSLLQGVTGSGKTEVYLAAAAKAIEQGLQALLLVPEINLTPQLEQRIASALPGVRVAVLHSRLGAANRRQHWLAVGLERRNATLAEIDRRHVGNVGGGPHRDHTGQAARGRGIDRSDRAVRMVRANHPHVELVREGNIAGIAAVAPDQRGILETRNRLPDPFVVAARHRRAPILMAAARTALTIF